MDIFDLLRPPMGATADQVMRQAKAHPAGSINMLGGDDLVNEDLGQIGGNTAPMDLEVFADKARAAPELPFPMSMDFGAAPPPVQDGAGVGVMPQGQDIPQPPAQPPVPQQPASPSGGGLPVPPASSTAAASPVAAPPAQAPQPNALKQFREKQRQLSVAVAQKMMTGSPAMRVQGLQLLFSVQKDYQDELAEDQKKVDEQNERKRQELTIDASVADDTDKERAKTLVGLGARPQDVAEALRFNNQGATDRKDRREQFTKWGATVTQAARDLGTMETQEQIANKIIDESTATTGTGAWFAQLIPGSGANKLNAALDPIRALTGYGYLQEMREQSKTGGAVGNVTENETRWLMGIQGGLDPVLNDAKSLKENVKTIVEGKRIVLEMRKLAPALDAGDPAAWEKYSELTQQLAVNGTTVRQRMKVEDDYRNVEPAVQGAAYEKSY